MTWVEEMEVAIAGRGSVFHYQLAADHGDAFADIRRRHYRSLHAAVVAVTAFNARVTSHRLSAVHDTSRAVEDVIEKLERAFGPGLPEINVVRKKEPLTLTAGGALSAARNWREVAETRSIFERWCEAPKAAPHNCLCFLAAVHLNALT